MKLRILYVVFCTTLMSAMITSAQTYTLPDEVFKTCLSEHNPNLFNINGDLIIDSAGAYQGDIACRSEGITSADGIQFFSEITRLEISETQITEIPQIENLVNLNSLILNNNRLTAIPSLANFSDLTHLEIENNELVEAPILPESSNLLFLSLHNNLLTSLSDISNQHNLLYLNVSRNSSLGYIPSLSHLTKLQDLTIYLCGLDELPDLTDLSSLSILNAGYNNLTSIPDLGHLSTLKTIYLNDNMLNSISDLSGLPLLEKVRLYNNYLSFEDFTSFSSDSNYSEVFKIVSQYKFPINLNSTYYEGGSIEFKTTVAEELSNNVYRWFLNGELINQNTNDDFRIDYLELNKEGYYYFTVTNPNVPNLILQSDSVYVSVEECLNVSGIHYTVEQANCERGASISVDMDLQPQYGVSIELISNLSDEHMSPVNNEFKHLHHPEYTLQANVNSCIKEIGTIELAVPECDNAFFTPNGDGIDDTFFFNQEGIINIYNKWGVQIKSLHAPVEWDGNTNDNETISPGYYTIDVNNGQKIFHLSVVY